MIDRLEIKIKLPSTVSKDNAMIVSEECYDRHFFDTIDKVVSKYSSLYDFEIDNIDIDLGKISRDNIPSTLETLLTKAIEEKLPGSSDKVKFNNHFLQNSIGLDAEDSLDSKFSLFPIVWNYLRKGLVAHELEFLFQDSANYKKSSSLRKDNTNTPLTVSSDGQFENELRHQYSSKFTESDRHSSEFIDSDRYSSNEVTAEDPDSYASHHQIEQMHAARNDDDTNALQNTLFDDQPENDENHQYSSKLEGLDRYPSNEETATDSYTSRLQIEQMLAIRNYDDIIDLIKSDRLVLFRLSNIVDKEFLLHLAEALIYKSDGQISQEIISWAEKNLEKESVSSLIFKVLDDDEYVIEFLDMIKNENPDLKKKLLEYYHSVYESRLHLFDADQEVKEKRFHLEDAGLVLLAPFISTLFSRLEYLDENGGFVTVAKQFRAIHLLRRIVFPEKEKVHDYELNLCKVLCGVNPAFPIPSDIQLTEVEKNEIDNLLESVINYWTIINGTSIDGFRESFLKRFGTLEKSENMWIVRVEGSTIDILMEDLPWSFSALSYSWSQEVVYVEWQKPL